MSNQCNEEANHPPQKKRVLPIFVNFLSRHVVKLFGALLLGSLISVAKVARIELGKLEFRKKILLALLEAHKKWGKNKGLN